MYICFLHWIANWQLSSYVVKTWDISAEGCLKDSSHKKNHKINSFLLSFRPLAYFREYLLCGQTRPQIHYSALSSNPNMWKGFLLLRTIKMGRSYVAGILLIEKLQKAATTACFTVIFLSIFPFFFWPAWWIVITKITVQCCMIYSNTIRTLQKYFRVNICEKKTRLMKLQSIQIL